MLSKPKNRSKSAGFALGAWIVCFCLFGAGGAEPYSFVTKWPDVPEAWRFASPFGVAVDESGNVFVADTGKDVIRKFDSSGNLLGQWGAYGSGDGEFGSPHGIVVGLSGNVFVVDTENCRIQKFDSEGNFLGKWGSRGSGDGQFWGSGYEGGTGPIGIAVDSSGDIFVADTENHRIQKFDSEGNFLSKWGAYGTGDGMFSSPHGIAVDSSGMVFVADTGNHRIQKFDSSTGFLRQWGLAGSGDGEFRYPRGIAVDSSGTVLVADSENERIQEFDSLGNLIAVWGERGSGDGEFGGLPDWTGSTLGPSGIALDSSGNIFVADAYNERVQKFDSSGNFLTKWGYRGSADGEFNNPGSVAVDLSGNVFVVDTDNDRIQKFDSSGSFVTKWGSKGSGDGEFAWPFVWPPGIALDSSGNVLVADTGNARIQKFDSSGSFLGKWGYSDPDDGGVLQPYGIAVDSLGDEASGNVFVTDAERCRVIEFDSEWNFIRKWGSLGSADGEFNQPRGIAVDSSGNILVADTGNHRIQKFDSEGNFLATWGPEGSGDGEFSSPYSITLDSLGNFLVADTGNHRIQEFDASGNFLATWGSEGFDDGEFNNPYGIAADSAGNVFVADTGNHRVQKFRRLQPTISRQPDVLSNSCERGQDASSQSFEVWNSDGGTLSYTVTDDVTWLSCDPSTGSSSGEIHVIAVNYATSDLGLGNYFATITISDPDANNSPQHIDVTLTVRSSTVTIMCQPTSLYSSCDQGENALLKSFDVWNSGGGTLSYTITDDVAWLFCSPTSGTSIGERDSVRVGYNTSGLEPGDYSAKISVSDPLASNSPQHVDVTLIVRPKPAALGYQPDSLSNSCDEGENASSQSFEVWNLGGAPLHYSIGDNAPWLTCTPASGTSTGEHDTITAIYSTYALEPGSYSATITVSDPNATNSPQTIGVSLTVHQVTVSGTLASGSATTIQGDQTPFPLTISLDLPYDVTYLAMTVEFPQDSFTAVSYAEAGRAVAAPAAEGIDNTTGEVRIVWMSQTGGTVIPSGSGPVATIEFEQHTGVSEGLYPVAVSDTEARYGPQEYRLDSAGGEIEVVGGSLDVDENGAVEPATDIVYIHRYLVEMPETVPSGFREVDPSIPPDDEIESRITDLMPFLDVDASGGDPDPATDIVYIYRYLVGMPATVPTTFREIDPSIPPDEEINAAIDAINIPKRFLAPQEPGSQSPLFVQATDDVIRIAHVEGQRGSSITVPVSLNAPDEDLSYLRLWVEYDRTKLTPRELVKAGRTSVQPMPDWLNKENGRIRAVVESLEGDVVIPKGTGAVIEIVFDVLDDTTSSDSLHIEGDVEAGLGPKKVAVVVSSPVAIAPGPDGIVSLRWQPFGSGAYTVLYCEDLLVGNWLPVEGTVWPIAQTSWQGEPPSNAGRGYYRVKSE